VNVSPGFKCGNVGVGEGVQVGSGGEEGTAMHCRGKEDGSACAGGKLVIPMPPSHSGRWSCRQVAVEFNPAL
jgi:hypothetical protein